MPEKLTPEAVEQAPEVTLADVTDEEILLQELAALSPLAYDRRREEAAKRFGVRVSTLDVEVATRRPRYEEGNGVGTAILFTDPDPWPDPVDGAALLSDLADVFARHANVASGRCCSARIVDAAYLRPRGRVYLAYLLSHVTPEALWEDHCLVTPACRSTTPLADRECHRSGALSGHRVMASYPLD
jgi:hypothetical protein